MPQSRLHAAQITRVDICVYAVSNRPVCVDRCSRRCRSYTKRRSTSIWRPITSAYSVRIRCRCSVRCSSSWSTISRYRSPSSASRDPTGPSSSVRSKSHSALSLKRTHCFFYAWMKHRESRQNSSFYPPNLNSIITRSPRDGTQQTNRSITVLGYSDICHTVHIEQNVAGVQLMTSFRRLWRYSHQKIRRQRSKQQGHSILRHTVPTAIQQQNLKSFTLKWRSRTLVISLRRKRKQDKHERSIDDFADICWPDFLCRLVCIWHKCSFHMYTGVLKL